MTLSPTRWPLLDCTGLCGNQIYGAFVESSRRPARHRRDACSMAYAPDALVDFHTGTGPRHTAPRPCPGSEIDRNPSSCTGKGPTPSMPGIDSCSRRPSRDWGTSPGNQFGRLAGSRDSRRPRDTRGPWRRRRRWQTTSRPPVWKSRWIQHGRVAKCTRRTN